MKVLWISNIVFPEALSVLTGNSEMKTSGGWMVGAAETLVNMQNLTLAIASPTGMVRELRCIKGASMLHYLFPLGNNPSIYENYWKRINDEFKPDIVHIHGTEMLHGWAYVNACGANNVVVSIQGMTSAYNYYYYGLTIKQILSNFTLRNFIKGGILKSYKSFKRRSTYEIDLLTRVHHIIGRTSWDQARTWAINPQAQYHFCNETLRKEFYEGNLWSYNKCLKHSIFISQANYPIKGLHMLLRAMPLILHHYPDAEIRVAGLDITRNSSWKERLKITDYGSIIKNYIEKYKLVGKVSFTGPLNAQRMKQEYLNCNVFVCSSSIENSPNSLGEAQILGVPCVASYVGGVPDMMKGDEDNLYRFEEVEMLAWRICNLFEKSKDCNNTLVQKRAKDRHDPQNNMKRLIDIYDMIYTNK